MKTTILSLSMRILAAAAGCLAAPAPARAQGACPGPDSHPLGWVRPKPTKENGDCVWTVSVKHASHGGSQSSPCIGGYATAITDVYGMQVWGEGEGFDQSNGCTPSAARTTIGNDSEIRISVQAPPGCLPSYHGEWRPSFKARAELIDHPAEILAAGHMHGDSSPLPLDVDLGGGKAGVTNPQGSIAVPNPWGAGDKITPFTTAGCQEEPFQESVSADYDGDANVVILYGGVSRIEVTVDGWFLDTARGYAYVFDSLPQLLVSGMCKPVAGAPPGTSCTGRVTVEYLAKR